MLPLGHFLLALLPVGAHVLLRYRRLPGPKLVGDVFLGSQFPDRVDKPLAHQFFLLPSGRVFMHSLPIAVPIWIGVLAVARNTDRPRGGGAFVFAWAPLLAGDSYRAFLGPDPRIPSDLLWPLRPPIQRPIETG